MAQVMPWEEYQSAPTSGGGQGVVIQPEGPTANEQTKVGLDVAGEARQGRKEQFDYAKDLRNEFRKAPESVNYETVARQFSSALTAKPTPTGDQSLITAYAKMLDPGSVVRTEEFNTVQAGDSKLGSIVARLQKELGVDDSGLIRPEVRNRVLTEMKNLTEGYRQSYDRLRGDYEGLSNSYGVSPTVVVGSRIDEPYLPKIEKAWSEKFPSGETATPVELTAGQKFSTEEDKAIAAAVNQVFAQGGGVQELVAAAEGAGGQVSPDDLAAFQQAIELRAKGQPVNFEARQTGSRSPLAQAAGEALMTPAGTALTGAVNAAGMGTLSQFAGDQVQGLEALNPKMGLAGEVIGSALGTAGLAKGAGAALSAVAPGMATRLAGGGLAGTIGREVATEAAYGGGYAANTGQDIGTGMALGAVGSLGGQAVAAGARRAAPIVAPAFNRLMGREAVPSAIPSAGGEVPPMAGAAPSAVPEEPFAPVNTSFRGGGAEGTSPENLRRMQAESLPVPVDLTKGAASREAEQLAFEKEQIFGPLGGPLRRRAEENNVQVLENFDRFIDQTGAQAPTVSATGNAVIDALSKGYSAAKNKVNVAYKRAENSPGAQEPVDYAELKAFIDQQDEATKDIAPVLKSAAQQLAKNDPEGTGQIPVSVMENIRKLITQNAQGGTPSAAYAGKMKGIIDDATADKGGDLYKEARKLRIEQARKFENRAIVARLVSNVKNMDDPKVAADKVFQRSIMDASPEEIAFLRRTLRTSGKEGRQAWQELQGATIRNIQEQTTKGAGMDSENNPIVSVAKLNQELVKLDKNGRLDVIFDPKTAQQLRDLRDVVSYVNTVPPGTSINNSGTTRTLIAALAEMGGMGAATGIPLPVISGLKLLRDGIRDAKIKAKITKSLVPSEPK